MKVIVNTNNKGTLNMRAEPSSSAPILTKIPYGTELEASIVNDEWSQVAYKDSSGYVMSKFLSAKISSTITKDQLQKIYDNLKSTLKTIEEVLN